MIGSTVPIGVTITIVPVGSTVEAVAVVVLDKLVVVLAVVVVVLDIVVVVVAIVEPLGILGLLVPVGNVPLAIKIFCWSFGNLSSMLLSKSIPNNVNRS